ncbi:CYTH and CHAD domain-containing protein [Advenella sp. WQ 585]|uniref:CYTH and CHAD domain-containing protein n=1 Tax=Advenella mandrilli TaxID=2800330 RepID=A0ABS1EER4_9BURK|nr:CYTH and CHAD domain-containing protein [Advenella mandrilli]MBK1781685.1 CYTH and CHAD domain-containing protein [Advenella mandrilli]
MSEQELKLHVPIHAQKTVEKAVRTTRAEELPLRALYFDTPTRELAKAKVAIRLRLEGTQWVQTLKMPGNNAISKLELNHDRPGPILDLSLYAGTPAEAALTNLNHPLELRYETDVIRIFRKHRVAKGILEIAYDRGVIRAGDLELPVSEVEFELMSGSPEAIFEVGLRWLEKYKLQLDLRSKSHRGDALATAANNIKQAQNAASSGIYRKSEIDRFWAPRKARPYPINKNQNATQALITTTDECLEQICFNAGPLAEIDTLGVVSVGRPEHVHQLRIGMRRLASNWKLFGKMATLPEPELQAELKVHLGHFGATRDLDVMLETIVPKLEEAGMPHIQFEHHESVRTAQEIAQSVAFQSWLVKLLKWTVLTPAIDPIPETVEEEEKEEEITETQAPEEAQASAEASETGKDRQTADSTAKEPPALKSAATKAADSKPALLIIPLIPSLQPKVTLRKQLEARLNKWNKEIVNHWKTEDKSDIEAYHDLRKKIKRMRYGLNVYEALHTGSNLNFYVKRLAAAQETFGILNDYSTAHTFYSQYTHTYPQTWFAVGWLSANLETCKKHADEVLKELPRRIKF